MEVDAVAHRDHHVSPGVVKAVSDRLKTAWSLARKIGVAFFLIARSRLRFLLGSPV